MSEDELIEEVEAPREIAGTVAIVGFPNVGKSTLINRLTQSRAAVVHETPGVTRDRKEMLCEWSGTWFRLIDTGGVDEVEGGVFGSKIAEQAKAAIDEADLVLFVVDARAGITPGDEELAVILRAAKRPVIVLANKIDDPRRDPDSAVFHSLGLGEPWPLSGLHGHGTGDLLDEIVSRLPGTSEVAIGTEAIRVAILGRPNVGKSSLLNKLVGRERVIVSEIPGTTRDAIDTVLQRGRHDLRARRHGRAAQAPQAAPGHRVLQRAASPPGRRPRRCRARPLRRVGGDRGAGSRGRRHRPQGGLLHPGGAVQVGRDRARDRRGAGAPRAAAAPAAAGDRRLGQDRPRHRPPARQGRAALREAQRQDHDRRAQPRPR